MSPQFSLACIFFVLLQVFNSAYSVVAAPKPELDSKQILYCLGNDGLGASAPEESAPNVATGIYVLNLVDSGIIQGRFDADFFLFLRQDHRPLDASAMAQAISVVNTVTPASVTAVGNSVLRISGKFVFKVDLSRYPFDKQDLEIILENQLTTSDQFMFVPDPRLNGLSSSVRFPGFGRYLRVREGEREFSRCSFQATTKIYPGNDGWGPVTNRTVSRYRFALTIERPKLSSFFVVFLPPMFIMLPALYSYWLKESKDRIAICATTLVSLILNSYIARGTAGPPRDYLTLADQFMIVSYCIVIIAILVHMFILKREMATTEKAYNARIASFVKRWAAKTMPWGSIMLYFWLAIGAYSILLFFAGIVFGVWADKAISWTKRKTGFNRMVRQLVKSGHFDEPAPQSRYSFQGEINAHQIGLRERFVNSDEDRKSLETVG